MQTKRARIIARAVAGLILVMLGCGFVYLKNTTTGLPIKWPAGTIPMKISADTGSNGSRTLMDGTTEATCIQNAMKDPSRGWNQYLGDEQFAPTIVAPGTAGMDGDGVNQVFFSNSVYGMAFATDGTLAVTTEWYSGNQRVEADIIFNTAYTWDSYRGALFNSPIDLQRVALHELGHVLGLDHPDTNGQTVAAVMNSHVSNTDSLTADDIAGGQSLYGPPGIPANDNFASAINITLANNAAVVTGFNTNATKELGEPNHANNAGGRSVWWKWTAPSTGMVTLTTQGSVFDTTLGVYVGSAVSSLTAIASNDDVQDGVIQYSSVTFNATGGVTYYFAVDGFNNTPRDNYGADSGAVTLNLSFTSSGPTTTSTTTIPPSSGGGGGGGGAPSVWFFGALSLLACARRLFPKKG